MDGTSGLVQPNRYFCVVLSRLIVAWILCFAPALALPSVARDGDWTAFRGPGGDGIAVGESPIREWGPSKNLAWRVRLSGSGNGSPIVVDGRVLLTCCTDLGRRRTLCCYRAADGRELWAQSVTLDVVELTHKSNPYCGTSPCDDSWQRTFLKACHRES